MRLVYEHESCAAIARFAMRQLQDVLAKPPFDGFDVAGLTLRVRARGVPGAWYDPEAHEIVVDAALYDHALLVLTNLFTAPPSPTSLPLVEAAKAWDTMMALFATRNYQEFGSYNHGFGPNHWIKGYRVTRFEAFVADRLAADPGLAVPIEQLRPFFGEAVGDVALWLSTHLDQCVDVARFFFVFVCLHELGHHVYAQDERRRGLLFDIAGETVARPPADGEAGNMPILVEEQYADAFAVIGVAMCEETTLSGEQFLFVRAYFEFVVSTLIDTIMLLEQIYFTARYGDNRLLKFTRFNGLRHLQQRTTGLLDKWEINVRRSRGLEEHYLTANPAFSRFDFHFLAKLHTAWLDEARRAIADEGQIPASDGGI